VPGLGAAFVRGCLFPEQLPRYRLLSDSSRQDFYLLMLRVPLRGTELLKKCFK